MRFGVCCWGFEQMETACRKGYDYLELPLAKLAKMTEEEFAELKGQLASLSISAEAVNQFFMSGTLVGDEVDMEQLRAYTQRALSRAAQLGVRVAVVGSGKARTVPEGYDVEKATAQFVAVMRMCGTVAAQYGITVVLEPLNVNETNLINTVQEGVALCRRADHPNVRALADFYHVVCNGETMEAVTTAGDMLAHVHLACGERRCMPKNQEDREVCQTWAAALKENGYDARISLEGHFDDFEADITAALPILKQVF